MSWNPAEEWPGFIPPRPLEEYSERYKDFFKFTRRDGILEVRMHTDNGIYKHSHAAHSAWKHVWQDIGNDLENHVIIFTGTGDMWMTGEAKGLNPKPASDLDPEHIFQRMMDGWKHIENFVNCIDVPTIAAVNGPGVHTEFAVLCDVTLAAPDADFLDPHFWLGSPPGDGQGMALAQIMGHKRAAHHIYDAKSISAKDGVEFGLVNEILPRKDLNDRAWELARKIAKRPRYVRWAAHNVISRHWKKLIADDFGFHMAHQMIANVASKSIVPNPDFLKERPRPF